jgi:hypothetical protein
MHSDTYLASQFSGPVEALKLPDAATYSNHSTKLWATKTIIAFTAKDLSFVVEYLSPVPFPISVLTKVNLRNLTWSCDHFAGSGSLILE